MPDAADFNAARAAMIFRACQRFAEKRGWIQERKYPRLQFESGSPYTPETFADRVMAEQDGIALVMWVERDVILEADECLRCIGNLGALTLMAFGPSENDLLEFQLQLEVNGFDLRYCTQSTDDNQDSYLMMHRRPICTNSLRWQRIIQDLDEAIEGALRRAVEVQEDQFDEFAVALVRHALANEQARRREDPEEEQEREQDFDVRDLTGLFERSTGRITFYDTPYTPR